MVNLLIIDSVWLDNIYDKQRKMNKANLSGRYHVPLRPHETGPWSPKSSCSKASSVFPSTQRTRGPSLLHSLTAHMAVSSPAMASPPLTAPGTHRGPGFSTLCLSPSPSWYPPLSASSSPAISTVLKPKPRVRNYASVWCFFDPRCLVVRRIWSAFIWPIGRIAFVYACVIY